jgi:hypothetical protein
MVTEISLFQVLLWYTFVVICFIFWILFMVAFNINRQRLSWLWAQFFLFLGLVFAVVFEKKRCKYINQNKKELIVIDYD